MSTDCSASDFFVTGGTMPPDAGSYISRSADAELLRAVENGEYCYVLTTRQMGKSSLMVRTARHLAEAGIRSAQITLETIRTSDAAASSDQFLYGIAWRIHKELGLTSRIAEWWRARDMLSSTQRFFEFLSEFLLDSCDSRIVVFIDEIDSTIGLPFADDFYATIRACYNGRASNPALERLTFVLLGVATPAQLIADPTRTPFNIGKGIELTDFTTEEATPLAAAFPGTAENRHDLLERVLYWTGGHPYLTQTLCRAIATRASEVSVAVPVGSVAAIVDETVERLFLSAEAAREERNLKFVRSRLTQGSRDLRAVLQTYQRVLAGKSVEDKPASSIHASLKLAGVVRTDADGVLRPRNRIYEHVFGPAWVRRELPRDRWRTAAAAAAVLLVVGGGASYLTLQQSYLTLQRTGSRLVQQEFQSALLERLATADYLGLVKLAREPGSSWEEAVLADEFLARVDPGVFATAPWREPDVDHDDLFLVLERSYRLLVPSKPLFGAMSFALEEVFVRNPGDATVRARARSLADEIRDAFVQHHLQRTPGFQRPPTGWEDDPLNVWVTLPPGEFEMGAADLRDAERPPHRVRIESSFAMQRYEVTNDEYRRFDPTHDFPVGQERHPVANVTWYEAAAYAAWLGASLPTEAEWEYAARGTGGTSGRRYPWGDAAPTEDRAVYSSSSGESSRSSTLPVGSRPAGRTPGDEGLDDLAGNVWEWCRDWFGPYDSQSAVDPIGPIARDALDLGGSPVRVLRGGSFGFTEVNLRAAIRGRNNPDLRGDGIGFRLVSSRLRR